MDDLHPWMPALAENPYPWYADLRANDPVHYSARLDAWFVTRYDDVVRVLRAPEEFSSSAILTPMPGAVVSASRRGFIGAASETSRVLITADPPDHTRLRRLVSRPFTPSAIAALEPFIRALSIELVDDLVAASARGEADLIAQLGSPLPLRVIAHMLGVDADREDAFREWSSAMTFGPPADTGHTMEPGRMLEMFGYLAETIEARRADPRDDLISMLVSGPEPLNAQELLTFTTLLLIAGNETTTSLVGNAMLALWAHPDQLERLVDEPALVPSFVEEALRYDTPAQALCRQTTRDVDVGGVTIPGGRRVFVLYGSANRDEDHFADPDRLDIARDPCDHVAFGTGIHFCLGAPLARLEARVATETLLERVRAIRPAGEVVRKATSPEPGPALLRGVACLPVSIEAR